MRIRRLLVLGLIGVWSSQTAAEIQIYDVAPQYRQEVASLLAEMITPEADPNRYPDLYGRVRLLATGQILVDASTNRHAEIARLIEALESGSVEASPTITLRYWVVFGEPGGQDSSQLPAELADPLRELDAAQGPFGFTLLDSATLTSGAGQGAVLESENIEIVQEIYPNGDRINAELVIENEFQELVVQIALNRGEFVVLGNSTITSEDGTRGTLATIVQWPEGN